MIWPCDSVHFLEHGLEPFLELAAVLGPGDQRAHVERDDPLVLQPLRHVAADDALGQPFDDGRLADARLADQHRVVLGPAGQHLDDAANLLVAADDRVELALPGRLRQVAAILFQRLVGLFRVLRGDALPAADLLQGRHQPLPGDAEFLEDAAGGAAVVGHGQQQMLDGNVLVLELLGLVLGPGHQGVEPAGDVKLVRRAALAGNPRHAFQLLLDADLQRFRRNVGLIQEWPGRGPFPGRAMREADVRRRSVDGSCGRRCSSPPSRPVGLFR